MDTQREIIIERNGPCSTLECGRHQRAAEKKNTPPASLYTHTRMAVPRFCFQHQRSSESMIRWFDSNRRFDSFFDLARLDSTRLSELEGLIFCNTHTNAFFMTKIG